MITVDDCLDLLEVNYQYKDIKTNELFDFRALTAQDGEVYIEFINGRTGRQVNKWIDMNDPCLYLRVESSETVIEEYEWGTPMGSEVW